ncbi:hypothetical protein GSN00_05590 [Cylindrospermopsis raciborskii CHAB3438]|uniref:hypothetical protein n=1 Tax=Cylindrospermopsis raciborskii TaxID=77022 RepID=UPI001F105A15|nr:hypothetical protein [Cylindrospermopsis raciborskii]MCH4903872.1 hypothetical protein [Cylindrospermopsis raciborskii CHAB3438]
MVIAFLLFTYLLSGQALFYPILIGVLLTSLNIRHRIKKSELVFSLTSILFLYFVAVSMWIRGASVIFIVRSSAFYVGLLFVSSVMFFNRKLKVTTWHLIMLGCVSIYEFLSLNLFRVTPIFYQYSAQFTSDFLLKRSDFAGGVYRAIGPALNSSISGSIYAILFWYYLKVRNFYVEGFKDYIVCTILLLAFLFSGSFTAVVTFAFIFVYLVYDHVKSKMISTGLLKKLILLLFLLSFAGMVFPVFLTAFQQAKLNPEYLLLVLNLKIQQLQVAIPDFFTLLFGDNLSSRGNKIATVGDALLIDFTANIGLVALILFVQFIYLNCYKKNRVFLIAAVLSSLHYGVLFSLTGQIVVAALITDSIETEIPQKRI